MGGDGGSIPGRTDLVRTSGYTFARNLGGMGYSPNTQMRAADEHMSSSEIKELRWQTCSLTQAPLSLPIVACRLGLLYNKEAVIKYILAKKAVVSMQHTKNLKDFKDVKFMVDPSTKRFICPLTRTEFGATNRGILIWKCGCCVSEKAFKELIKHKVSQRTTFCPNCNEEFTYHPQFFEGPSHIADPLSHDLVLLVPDSSEEGYLRAKLITKVKTTKAAAA
ncbi:hypothetical protein X943_003361 [Babesia divergens]|uniref:Replication termination factor 2 n=1 Tax=Babesia divergens TaxID=32595 RepID=A0AAD9GDG3_BABDI|nr:hypothetical protein X943_003361 [Babesia divergens]